MRRRTSVSCRRGDGMEPPLRFLCSNERRGERTMGSVSGWTGVKIESKERRSKPVSFNTLCGNGMCSGAVFVPERSFKTSIHTVGGVNSTAALRENCSINHHSLVFSLLMDCLSRFCCEHVRVYMRGAATTLQREVL